MTFVGGLGLMTISSTYYRATGIVLVAIIGLLSIHLPQKLLEPVEPIWWQELGPEHQHAIKRSFRRRDLDGVTIAELDRYRKMLRPRLIFGAALSALLLLLVGVGVLMGRMDPQQALLPPLSLLIIWAFIGLRVATSSRWVRRVVRERTDGHPASS